MNVEYITPHGREALKSYKYAGTDKSLLYKHVLSPWAQYCVDTCTPMWIAPNTITLIGLALQASALLVAYVVAPDFGQMDSAWSGVSALYAAFCIFAYQTLDNMDGKHARRSGSSSPLGLLFDHGCDAINAGIVGWAGFALHCASGSDSWRTLALWLVPTFPFFFNTWEEFHIGELILPVVNGPNEGILASICLLATTAIFGTGMWSMPHVSFPWLAWSLTPVVDAMRWMAGEAPVFGATTPAPPGSTLLYVLQTYLQNWMSNWAGGSQAHPISNLDLVLAVTVGSGLATAAYQTFNVIRFELRKAPTSSAGAWTLVGYALARQVPFWSLICTCMGWLHIDSTRAVVRNHWFLFYLTAGFLFVDMTTKLMVSHVCDQDYKPFLLGIGLFAVAPTLLILDLLPNGPEPTAVASLFLLLSFALAFLYTTFFLYHCVNEIARALDIDIFSIEKQVARAKAGTAAGATSQLEAQGKLLASPTVVSAAKAHFHAAETEEPAAVADGGKAGKPPASSGRRGSSSTTGGRGASPGGRGGLSKPSAEITAQTGLAGGAGSLTTSTTAKKRRGSASPARRR